MKNITVSVGWKRSWKILEQWADCSNINVCFWNLYDRNTTGTIKRFISYGKKTAAMAIRTTLRVEKEKMLLFMHERDLRSDPQKQGLVAVSSVLL